MVSSFALAIQRRPATKWNLNPMLHVSAHSPELCARWLRWCGQQWRYALGLCGTAAYWDLGVAPNSCQRARGVLKTLIPGASAVAYALSRLEGAQCHSATHQRDGGFNNRRSDPERATQATGDSSLGCPYESRSKLDEAGRETSRLALLLSEL